MGAFYWVRVIFMCLTLAAVVYAIRYFNSTPPKATPVAKLIVGNGDSEKITLCPTRVVSLQTAAGLRLREHKMRWVREDGSSPVELSPIAVEKWFAQNCTLSAQETHSGQNFTPVLTLTFVNGQSAALTKSPSGEYQWQGHTFVSPKVDEALHSLANLPAAAAPGSTADSGG